MKKLCLILFTVVKDWVKQGQELQTEMSKQMEYPKYVWRLEAKCI